MKDILSLLFSDISVPGRDCAQGKIKQSLWGSTFLGLFLPSLLPDSRVQGRAWQCKAYRGGFNGLGTRCVRLRRDQRAQVVDPGARLRLVGDRAGLGLNERHGGRRLSMTVMIGVIGHGLRVHCRRLQGGDRKRGGRAFTLSTQNSHRGRHAV